MKQFIKYISFLGLASFVSAGCKPNLEEVTPGRADLDLSKYVAVGDFITAGYMNGAITAESQQYAYPAILAQQFAKAGGNQNFVQPLFESIGDQQEVTFAGYNAYGSPVFANTEKMYQRLFESCRTTQIIPFARFGGASANNIQNFGVPGLRFNQIKRAGLGDVANNNPPYGNPPKFNPYFERMLPANDARTYLQVVTDAKPTFFTCWIGMAEIAAYAMTGGTCPSNLPNKTAFKNELTSLLDSLSANGTRQGIICNLPAFEDFAFSRLALPEELEKKFQNTYNQDTSVHIWITQNIGGVVRRALYNDYLLPNALAKLNRKDPNLDTKNVNGNMQIEPYGLSKYNPLPNDEVLDANEKGILTERISKDYNAAILELVPLVPTNNSRYKKSIALVEMNTLFLGLRNGVIFNGVKYSGTPVSGGFFSLDNFTVTPRGQAIIANKIIQTINTAFGSSISEVNVNAYPLPKGL